VVLSQCSLILLYINPPLPQYICFRLNPRRWNHFWVHVSEQNTSLHPASFQASYSFQLTILLRSFCSSSLLLCQARAPSSLQILSNGCNTQSKFFFIDPNKAVHLWNILGVVAPIALTCENRIHASGIEFYPSNTFLPKFNGFWYRIFSCKDQRWSLKLIVNHLSRNGSISP